MSDRLDFAHLKRVVTIEDTLRAEGLIEGLRRRGDRLVGPCPIHGGDNPTAFVVTLSKGLWHCFTGCNAGGDVVELVCRTRRLSYRDAAEHLAAIADGMTPSEPTPKPSNVHATGFIPYRRQLALEHHCAFLRRKGIGPDTARLFEAGDYRGFGFLQGCVAVRLCDISGAPMGYAGRTLEPSANVPKWRFPPRFPKGRILYGQHLAPTANMPLVIVECPWGVMRLHQLGCSAVALLGCSASASQLDLLRQRTTGLTIMLDGDEAGRRAASHLARQLAAHLPVATVLLPHGCDPDDLADDHLRKLLRLPRIA